MNALFRLTYELCHKFVTQADLAKVLPAHFDLGVDVVMPNRLVMFVEVNQCAKHVEEGEVARRRSRLRVRSNLVPGIATNL